MSKRVWLAALTAAFMAGSMAIAHAQAAGAGGDGGAAAGSGSSGGGSAESGSANRSTPSPYYKDERFPRQR